MRELQKALPGDPVKNYDFQTLDGSRSLLSFFGSHDKLLVIHNMGQACRYCTLWGDGLNPFVPHLESALGVLMVSKDDPDTMRTFANSRGWRFRHASHNGGEYFTDQVKTSDYENAPGIVCYERQGDNIVRKASGLFGPGDQYCSIWHVLGLAGLDASSWTPQYNYWVRPETLEDGGENVL